MRAMVYTVNEPDRARELLSCGIDGIVTDAVDRVHHFFTASEREFINYLNANGY